MTAAAVHDQRAGLVRRRSPTRDLPVGRRILEAVRATREAVGTNTNLGIVLLCGPLAARRRNAGRQTCATI